ncbi:MAG TPA: hypothetical protein DHV62_05410, partial [Elusimicrobia bacterium]|nr:hypothetical protein [Elusimicrobiota bacterium]
LRKNWEKTAETKAIKQIIFDIKRDKPHISDNELKKQLIQITAHKEYEIDDLLKLCRHSDEIINKVIEGKLDMSYLIQIESSFINPLRNKFPDLILKYGNCLLYTSDAADDTPC